MEIYFRDDCDDTPGFEAYVKLEEVETVWKKKLTIMYNMYFMAYEDFAKYETEREKK